MSRHARGLALLVLAVSLSVGAPMPASAGALAASTTTSSSIPQADSRPQSVPDWVCHWFPRLCRR